MSKTQSLKTAAEDLGLKVKTYENVDARGQDATGKQVVIEPLRPSWCRPPRDARERRERAVGNAEGRVLRRSHRPHHAGTHPALSEVETKVTDAWQAEERPKLAEAKVKEAVEKANAGTDLAAAIAKELASRSGLPKR